jgi:hypothetical protein
MLDGELALLVFSADHIRANKSILSRRPTRAREMGQTMSTRIPPVPTNLAS